MCQLTKFCCIVVVLLLNIPNGGLTQRNNKNNRKVDHTDVGKQVLIIKHIGNCDESKNYTFSMPYFKTVQIRKNVFVMSGIFEIRDNFTGRKMKATMDVRKCDDSFHTENCQPFVYWPINDLCDYLNSDLSFYGLFFKNYPDRPKCPLKPKSYNLTNIPLNLEIISAFPTFSTQNYVVYMKSYADKSLVGCFVHYVSLRTKRT